MSALPPLPPKRRGMFCTKCGHSGITTAAPPSAPCENPRCGYTASVEEVDYSDEEMREYGERCRALPAGWVAVPVEPTEAMLDAAARASMKHLLDCINDPARAKEVGSEEMVRKTHASRYRTMLAAAPQPEQTPTPRAAPAETTFCWLVEEFRPDGSSTGIYMAGYQLDEANPHGDLKATTTTDPLKARRYRWIRTAMFRAEDMQKEHGGDWRAVRHGFMLAAAPQPEQTPAPMEGTP